jgi:hypothetical protein
LLGGLAPFSGVFWLQNLQNPVLICGETSEKLHASFSHFIRPQVAFSPFYLSLSCLPNDRVGGLHAFLFGFSISPDYSIQSLQHISAPRSWICVRSPNNLVGYIGMKRTASERKRSSEDQGLARRQRSVCWDEGGSLQCRISLCLYNVSLK